MKKIETKQTVLDNKEMRSLFDYFGYEFNRGTLDNKIISLEKLHQQNSLQTVVKEYCEQNKQQHDLLNDLKPTLSGYINYVRFGKFLRSFKLEELAINELVAVLSEVLSEKKAA